MWRLLGKQRKKFWSKNVLLQARFSIEIFILQDLNWDYWGYQGYWCKAIGIYWIRISLVLKKCLCNYWTFRGKSFVFGVSFLALSQWAVCGINVLSQWTNRVCLKFKRNIFKLELFFYHMSTMSRTNSTEGLTITHQLRCILHTSHSNSSPLNGPNVSNNGGVGGGVGGAVGGGGDDDVHREIVPIVTVIVVVCDL